MITDESVKYLTKLTSLDLRGNKNITDETVKEFTKLVNFIR